MDRTATAAGNGPARRTGAASPGVAPRRGLFLALAALALLGPGRATAAAQAVLPGARLAPGALAADPIGAAPAIDRDRIDRAPAEVPLPTAQPPRSETADPASAQAPNASPADVGEATSPAATLASLRFEGSSLEPQLLDAVSERFRGRPLDRPTLQAVANAVTALYARSDVAFYGVSIPAQRPREGVLVVRVVEGRIADWTLADPTRSTPDRLIARHVARLLAETPTRRSTLERTLSLIRDIPGQTVTARLLRTGRADELRLELAVKRRQLEFSFDLNNAGVANVTSGMQLQVGVEANGVLREGDSSRIVATAPFEPHRYQFYSLVHRTPVGSDGTMLSLSGAWVKTTRKVPAIRGEAKQAGIAISRPILRSYKRNLTATLSFDGTDSDNYYLDTAFGSFRSRALRAGFAYSSQGRTSGFALGGSVSRGLDLLGAEPLAGYSQVAFTKFNLQGTAVAQVVKRVTLRVSLRGQVSASRLPTTERFSLGGQGAGLAFRAGTVTADSGAAALVQTDWQLRPPRKGRADLALFAWVDGAVGHGKARPAYAIAARDSSLASAGAGMRLGLPGGWSVDARIAIPLKAPGPGYSKRARLLFGIGRQV